MCNNEKLTMEQVLNNFIKLADPTALVRLKYLADQELLERAGRRMKEVARRRFGPHEPAAEVDGNLKTNEGGVE
jgi:hypothetical protein